MCVSEPPIYIKPMNSNFDTIYQVFYWYGFERRLAVITVNNVSSCSAVITSASSAVCSV